MPKPEYVGRLIRSIEAAEVDHRKEIHTAENIEKHIKIILENIELVKDTSERLEPTDSTSGLLFKVLYRTTHNLSPILTIGDGRMFKAYWHLINMHDLEVRNSSKTFAELMQAILDY